MAIPGRPPNYDLIDRAMEIQAWADEIRRDAKAQLAEERRLQHAAQVRQMTDTLADAHIALGLATALKVVGWRMAGRATARKALEEVIA